VFFEKRNNVQNLVVDNTTPRYSSKGNSTWLTHFVKLVGKEKAVELTQNILVREQLEMDKLIIEMDKEEQLYDWISSIRDLELSRNCRRKRNSSPPSQNYWIIPKDQWLLRRFCQRKIMMTRNQRAHKRMCIL